MGKCVIDKENVVAPGRCHLILDVDETRLGVTVIDPIVSDPLWRSIELTPALSPSRGAGFVESGSEALVKSLEEAVYDNPVLLSGFSSVEVILHTPWFAMVPPEISADAEMRMTVAEASVPEEAADATMIELPPLSAEAPDFVMYADTRLVDFLRRTFANPMFRHLLKSCAGISWVRILLVSLERCLPVSLRAVSILWRLAIRAPFLPIVSNVCRLSMLYISYLR